MSDWTPSRIASILKDTQLYSNLRNIEKDKNVNTVNIFDDSGYNEELLSKEGFVEALYAGDDTDAYTEEELEMLYDALNTLDGDDSENLSSDELEALAKFGTDSANDEIGSDDIQALLEKLASTLFLKDDAGVETDEDGNSYVTVDAWSSDSTKNNCLSRIIANNYDLETMGIEYGSEEYEALEKAVMDANPDIYGTEDGGWRSETGGTGRSNATLYTDDKIVLPTEY